MARIPSIQMSKKKLTDYFLANELHCSWCFLEKLLLDVLRPGN